MNDTSKPHRPGSVEETTEERKRRMAQHKAGPEGEVRTVPERRGSQAAPKAGPASGGFSPGNRLARS